MRKANFFRQNLPNHESNDSHYFNVTPIKFITPLDAVFILVFTLLLVYDYFPHFALADVIPKGVLLTLMLGLVVCSVMFKRYRESDSKVLLKWDLFLLIYIFTLMGILTLLGGQSTSGLSFNNGVMWIVVWLAVIEVGVQWKKVRQADIKGVGR